jgi:multidrug efflux pump subunit AcrA (membrane-fusion protein)
MIPISGVTQANGVSQVEVIDPKTKNIQKVTVKTGRTTQGSVAILEGLHPGDNVVIRH